MNNYKNNKLLIIIDLKIYPENELIIVFLVGSMALSPMNLGSTYLKIRFRTSIITGSVRINTEGTRLL